MRSEKELLKNEVKDKFKHFGSFVIMHYQKLTANAANDFRRQIRQSGGDVEIARKRVLLKAAEDAGVQLDQLSLTGHVGLVFLGQDAIETTKIVFNFNKDKEKVFHVLGGQFEGKLYNGEEVERLSTLPGKDEMRAQLLSVLEAPLSHTLSVMTALLTSVPYCLDNKIALQNGEVESGEAEAES